MTLVFENPDAAGKPGVHAFISGVSAYQHQPGFQPPPGQQQPPLAAESFGLGQLSSASLSALNFAQWLSSNPDVLAQPLASMRVLLSPQYGQPTMNSPAGQPVDRCSRETFIQDAINWRKDLVQNPDSIALFYFAGHGVQRTQRDSILLMDDFNNPADGAPLNNAISTINLYGGLSVHASRPNIARSQFLFIDACRVMPQQFPQYQTLDPPGIWVNELTATDQRSAPIFYAAQSGKSAAALPNDSTLFCKALLRGLMNDALRLDETTGQARWTVSSSSLKSTLDKHLDDLNKQYGGDQVVVVDGFSGDPILRSSANPPKVCLSIALEPTAAYNVTQVELRSQAGISASCPNPFVPNPCSITVDGGYYTLKATVTPPATFVPYQRIVRIEPMSQTLRAIVSNI